eukprot:6287782-Lingulodinium_polyedra.AAC.1
MAVTLAPPAAPRHLSPATYGGSLRRRAWAAASSAASGVRPAVAGSGPWARAGPGVPPGRPAAFGAWPTSAAT